MDPTANKLFHASKPCGEFYRISTLNKKLCLYFTFTWEVIAKIQRNSTLGKKTEKFPSRVAFWPKLVKAICRGYGEILIVLTNKDKRIK